MATIVNSTPATTDQSSGLGTLLMFALFLIAFVMLISYGIPALRSATTTPSLSVPEQVDVNVNSNPGGVPTN